MPVCLVGLGSNLGDRAGLLRAAMERLARISSSTIVAASGFHETCPAGGPLGQDAFLNAAVLLETSIQPEPLLAMAGGIEAELGRHRVERWGPRTIDIDLLLYDDLVLTSGELQLPHPRMAWRRFVLMPAAEVAPSMTHPRIGWTIQKLLDHLNGTRPYVALAGLPGVGKGQLARAVVDRLGGVVISDPTFDRSTGVDAPNSYGVTAAVELEFAKERAKAVAIDSPRWQEPCSLWISDFWVGQSAATLEAISDDHQRREFLERWPTVVEQACPARLTVLLDAPSPWCAANLADRGIRPAAGEDLERIDRIRRALIEQFASPGFGPILELDGRQPADAVEELAAAVAAMEDRRS